MSRGWQQIIGRVLAVATMAIVYAFLFAPMVVVVGASFDKGSGGFLNFPPAVWSLEGYWTISARHFETLWTSIKVATVTSVVSVILAVLAALGLTRSNIIGKDLLSSLFRAPLQMPHVVTGVAFLQAYHLIDHQLGLGLAGSFFGLVVGHVFMATPLAIGTVTAVLLRFNRSLEDAAEILGATKWSTFRRVTLPVIMPGVYAGGLYAFIVSFGDVPVSLFLANQRNTTFPVELFYSMEYDFNASILAISTLILIGSFVVLIAIQRAIGFDFVGRTSGSA